MPRCDSAGESLHAALLFLWKGLAISQSSPKRIVLLPSVKTALVATVVLECSDFVPGRCSSAELAGGCPRPSLPLFCFSLCRPGMSQERCYEIQVGSCSFMHIHVPSESSVKVPTDQIF